MTFPAWPIELQVSGRAHYTVWIPAQDGRHSAFLTSEGKLVTASSPSALEAVLESSESLSMLTEHRWDEVELPESLIPVALHGFDLDGLPAVLAKGQNRDTAATAADALAIVTGLSKAFDLPVTSALLSQLPPAAQFAAGFGHDLDMPLSKWRAAEKILADRWSEVVTELDQAIQPTTAGVRPRPEVHLDLDQCAQALVNGTTPYANLIPGANENFVKLIGMVIGQERPVLAPLLHHSDRVGLLTLIQPVVVGREPAPQEQQLFGLAVACEDRIILSASRTPAGQDPLLAILPIPSAGLRFGAPQPAGQAARTPFMVEGYPHPLLMIDGFKREASLRLEGLARGAIRARFALKPKV